MAQPLHRLHRLGPSGVNHVLTLSCSQAPLYKVPVPTVEVLHSSVTADLALAAQVLR